MPDIKEARRRFTLALTVLLFIDVAAAGVLLSPIGHSSRSGQAELEKLWSELRTKDAEIIPLRGIDGKVKEAKEEIATFYDQRFPASYSKISEELGKVATQNGVKIATAHYTTEPADVAGVSRVTVEVSTDSDYLHAVQFVNALERDKLFFLVNNIGLGEQQGGKVKLQIRLETYLKTA